MLKKLLLTLGALFCLPSQAAITNCIIGTDTSTVFGTADFGNLNPLSLPGAPIQTTLSYFGECTRTASTDPRRVQLRITLGSMSTNPGLTVNATYSTLLITLDWPSNGTLGTQRVSGTATYTLNGASTLTTPGLRTFTQLTTTQARTCPGNNNSGCSSYGTGREEMVYVNANFVKSCNIAPANLNFGNIAPSSTNAADASSSSSVACTNTTPYSVTFSGGNPAPSGQRAMVHSGGSETLRYQAYSDPGRTIVVSGSTGYTGSGTGASQSFNIYGRVFSNQFTQPGNYTDTLTMTVTY